MASLFNLDLEKQFLSGSILHPQTRAETAHITIADFSTTNRVVMSAIDAVHASGSAFSIFLLVDRLNSLGIKIGDSIEPGVYIKALEGLAVPESAVVGIAKELKRTTIRRELHLAGVAIAKATEKDEQLKASELVAKTTEIFNKKINILSGGGDDEPRDLFGTVGDFLGSETAFDTRSILTPFPTYNDLYGSWDPGGVVAIASRMKVGKSTFWLSAMQQLAAQDKDDNLRVLVLDTELTAQENQSRALSAISGVKEYFIRHKLYRKFPEMRAAVDKAERVLADLAGRVQHVYVGGMELKQMLTIAERWAFKTLKRGKKGLLVKDYFKLNSSSDFQTKARDITFGQKVDAFKNLAKKIEVPVLAFVQANRENEETKAGGKMANSAVISGGDMLAQFAALVFLLERLSPEELRKLCPDQSIKFTHRLLPLATRQLGPDNLGKNRLVRYREEGQKKDRWCDNYLLFNFDSFNVRECETPTLADLLARQRATGIDVTPEVPAEEQPAPVL